MKILVLAGGDSNERDVSLDSGAAVCGSLQRLGHEVRALDPATGVELLDTDGEFLLPGARALADGLVPGASTEILKSLAARVDDAEVVFIALHGGGGENGSIQNLLDLAAIRYTGSGRTASAVAMDKAIAKRVLASLDIATPDWELVRVDSDTDFKPVADEIAGRLSVPMIVKPNDGGSTIGLTKVTEANRLPEALEKAAEQSSQVLIEKYIAGRELTVAVFDGHAYPVVEIKPSSELYDYEAKYTKGKSEYVAPAEIDDSLSTALQEAATMLYEAIGCRGLARVDFILGADGRFYCLEVNTLPGMTELSLAPMAMKCEGIDFDKLVEMIVDSALKQ